MGKRLPDVVNLLVGVLLVYLLGFDRDSAVSWNAWFSGILIAGLAIAALTAFAEWEEWTNAVAGIWVIVSPWVVGFSANETATRTHVTVGLIVTAAVALRLWFMRQGPPHVTA